MSSLHTNRYRTLIARLKEARLRARLTQVQVAALLGKPQSFVSKIEQCERRLDPIELLDLAKVYGVELSVLCANLAEPREEAAHEQTRGTNRTNRRGIAPEGD